MRERKKVIRKGQIVKLSIVLFVALFACILMSSAMAQGSGVRGEGSAAELEMGSYVGHDEGTVPAYVAGNTEFFSATANFVSETVLGNIMLVFIVILLIIVFISSFVYSKLKKKSNKMKQMLRFYLIIALIFAVFAALPSNVSAVQPTPDGYTGNVYIDDTLATDGLKVKACVDGVFYDNDAGTISGGSYSLLVNGDDPDSTNIKEGALGFEIIVFWIENYVAVETEPFSSGGGYSTKNLNVYPDYSPKMLTINEIMVNSSSGDEWIELYNPTDASISLDDYKLMDNDGFSLSLTEQSVPASGFLKVDIPPGGSPSVPEPRLDNIGDEIKLVWNDPYDWIASNHDVVIDRVEYGTPSGTSSIGPNNTILSNAPLPIQDQSLILILDGEDNDDPANDFIITESPSPGASNNGINELPVAEAGIDQTVYISETVQFNGSNSFDPDGTIVSYDWNFGDGSEHESGVSPTHVYSESGEYTVTLTVEDNDGDIGEDFITVYVTQIKATPESVDFGEVEVGTFETETVIIKNIGDTDVTINNILMSSGMNGFSYQILSIQNPPTAVNDTYTTKESKLLNILAPGILDNDYDHEDDLLTAILESNVNNGNLILNSDGSFAYTPILDFVGTDYFTYKVNDGTDDSNIATVTITVEQNNSPVAVDDSFDTYENVILNVPAPGLLDNDYDDDNDSLTVSLVNDVSNGNLVLNEDGSFTYTPQTDFTGTDSFMYKAKDYIDDSNSATVTIQVSTPPTPVIQYDHGDPTNDEQLVLELINRARADPFAEGTRLGIDITEGVTDHYGNPVTVESKPPLAMNKILLGVARSHSQDMDTNGFFGHSSSDGTPWNQRISDAGYQGMIITENIAMGVYASAEYLYEILVIDSGTQGKFHRGHTLGIIYPDNEIGIGYCQGSNYNFITEDFGKSSDFNAFIVGVVYNDLDGDGFYDPGEGLGGVTVMPNIGTYYAVTTSSGGYAIPVTTDGSLTVSASGGTLSESMQNTISVLENGNNIKLDFIKNVGGGTRGVRSRSGDPTTPNQAYDHGDPSNDEQLVLELINRARADPFAEGTRLGIDITDGVTDHFGNPVTVESKPPLAMNKILLGVARSHSQDMNTMGYLTHDSSDGTDWYQRISNAGYQGGIVSENIAWGTYASAGSLHDILIIDSGTQGNLHRGYTLGLLFPDNEIGIGYYQGSNGNFITEDFGNSSDFNAFIVGVVYNDLDGDGFYDPGEGLGGVTVMPNIGIYYAVTSSSGGYAIPVTTDGSLTITASGGTLANSIVKNVNVLQNGDNVKLDFKIVTNQQPIANDDAYNVFKNNILNIAKPGILLNDFDNDDDPLDTILVDDVTNGSLSLNSDGSFIYTPSIDFTGTDSFTYKVTDGILYSNLATVTINIKDSIILSPNGKITFEITFEPEIIGNSSDILQISNNEPYQGLIEVLLSGIGTGLNNPPIANDQNITTDEDTAVIITLTASDGNSDDLTYEIVNNPLLGTLSGTAPDLIYTPDANIYGSDSFTFKANDGIDYSNIATVSIAIDSVNDPPVADNQYVATEKNILVSITLEGHDVDNDTLLYTIDTHPLNGSLSGTPPSLTYTPNNNFIGDDNFKFKVSDNKEYAFGYVYITVEPESGPGGGSPPPDGYSGDAYIDDTLATDGLKVKACVDGVFYDNDAGTISGGSYSLLVNGDDPNTTNFKEGALEFETIIFWVGDYVAIETELFSSGGGYSTKNLNVYPDYSPKILAINEIMVNPSSGDEWIELFNPTDTSISLDDYKLMDNDGFSLSLTGQSVPASGFLKVDIPPGGSPFAPVPQLNNTGDEIKLVWNDPYDWVASNYDVVIDRVEYVIPTGIEAGHGPDNTSLSNAPLPGQGESLILIPDGDDNDDPANDFEITNTPTPGMTNIGIQPPTPPQNLIAIVSGNDVILEWEPPESANQNGYHIYKTTIIDGNNEPDFGDFDASHLIATLSSDATYWTDVGAAVSGGTIYYAVGAYNNFGENGVVVKIITNEPPVAVDQDVTTDEDTTVIITLTASDVDEDTLTYVIVSPPSHGSLSGTPADLTYSPDTNYNGADSFTFKANDGIEDSNIATVSIIINSVNDTPVANDQDINTDEDTTVSITLTATDIDEDTLTYLIVSSPSHGSLSGTPPDLTYLSDSNYYGIDSFTFKAYDSIEDSNIATVSININPVNDAPVANSQLVTIDEDTNVSITLTASDIEDDPLTYIIDNNPSFGTLSGILPNLTYTPNANIYGTDSFTFKVNDDSSDSNIATISITINPVNDPPVAYNQDVTTDEDTALLITLIASDIENGLLNYYILDSPLNGEITGTLPNVTYSPNENYYGSNSFTFKVDDGELESNVATVSITVNPVNDPPVAFSQDLTTDEDTALSITLTCGDIESDPLIYSLLSGPSHGVLSGTPPSLTYIPDINYYGGDSFTFKVNDGELDSNIATLSITINPVNDVPVVSDIADQTINEGDPFICSGSFTDPDLDTWTATVNYGDGTGVQTLSLNLDKTFNLNYVYLDDDEDDLYTITVTVSDGNGGIGTEQIYVTVYNVAPTITSLTLPEIPIKVNDPVLLAGTFTDPGTQDTHTWTIDWGDTTTSGDVSGYTIIESHTYSEAGVYTVTLTVSDDDNGSDTEISQHYIVIYDPSSGFVTGGGWIDSPAGAYAADEELTGKASFGFVSKYKKGAKEPTGTTEFQFKAGDLNFHSDDYDWLVVAGKKAQFKGTGTINGGGEYKFILTAIDGDLKGGDGNDKFRIRIWEEDEITKVETTVYDNMPDAAVDADPDTIIGGGSIVIHAKGK